MMKTMSRLSEVLSRSKGSIAVKRFYRSAALGVLIFLGLIAGSNLLDAAQPVSPLTGPTADAVSSLATRKYDAFKAALDAGADVNAKVSAAGTLLHEAVARGTLPCVHPNPAIEKYPDQ